MNLLQRWRAYADRLAWRLDQPSTTRMSLWLIPLMFGLLSMKLGQDANWDLLNYHIYNPFAFLNGKIGIDLAPAQMQTYFNPTIDLLYYGLIHALPGPLVSFTMGLLHGLNFILLLIIAKAVLPPAIGGAGMRKPLLLAVAGVCGNGFVSELGNTMGDNLVALAVLGALALLLRQWSHIIIGAGKAALLLSGVLIGIGVGLKLTAAVFALALCASLFAIPLPLVARIRAAFVFGIGVLLGIGIAGGHWYWKMWTLFGNPLFPQFNSVFHSPLAGPISLGDIRFLPRGLFEYVLWPFVFALNPLRVSEMKIAGPIWPLLYVAGAALVIKFLLRSRATEPARTGLAKSTGPIGMIATFFALSYLIWMLLFSIYRYLVPVELLAPLMLWLCAQALLPRAVAGKLVALLLLCVIASNFFPRSNWGYMPLARVAVKAETPLISDPAQSLVFTLHHDAPLGWLIPQFPKKLAFVALDSNFPESDVFHQRVSAMIAERSGPMYAMFDVSRAHPNINMDEIQRTRSIAKYRTLLEGAIVVLSKRGLALDPSTCVTWKASLGDSDHPYQMCRVRTMTK